MKKKLVMFGAMFSLLIPYALADILQTLNNVWWKILSVGNLSFLGLSDGNAVVALTRLLIGVLVFAIIFGVIRMQTSTLDFLQGRITLVVAFVIATISAVFLPAEVLLATGTGFGTLVGLALVGGPSIAFLYLLITWVPDPNDNPRVVYFMKAILVAILIWVLAAMKVHVTGVLA